jgi:hypothetical protein
MADLSLFPPQQDDSKSTASSSCQSLSHTAELDPPSQDRADREIARQKQRVVMLKAWKGLALGGGKICIQPRNCHDCRPVCCSYAHHPPVPSPRVQKLRTKRQKHTTGGIPRWSPTLVLVARFSAYVWQSGRDAQFSLTYGRMC